MKAASRPGPWRPPNQRSICRWLGSPLWNISRECGISRTAVAPGDAEQGPRMQTGRESCSCMVRSKNQRRSHGLGGTASKESRMHLGLPQNGDVVVSHPTATIEHDICVAGTGLARSTHHAIFRPLEESIVPTCRFALLGAAAIVVIACGESPTAPSPATSSLPLASETAGMRYYHEPGDTIDVPRQEAFNAWAIERLGIVPSQKVEYRKYVSRPEMARYTGNGNTNGFAEPSLWRFHTIWPFDNHEVVHVYT